jgi:hypothetical protein
LLCSNDISGFAFSCKDEILEVSAKIYKAGMSLLVIDTENKFVSTGFAKEIARVAQGITGMTSIIINNCTDLVMIFLQVFMAIYESNLRGNNLFVT